jgi:FkbH-like protein
MIPDPIRVAVLADFTPEVLVGYLNQGDQPPRLSASTAGFGQVQVAIADPSAPVWAERPDAVLVWTRPETVSSSFARLLEGETVPMAAILEEVSAFAEALAAVKNRTDLVFVAAWAAPAFHRGNALLEMRPGIGIAGTIAKMNVALIDCVGTGSIHVLNTQRWIDAGGKDAVNPKRWYMAKLPFAHAVFKEAGKDLRAMLLGAYGQSRKLILLDLDDTLWGGIVGDDGWEKLNLGGHDPVGEAFVDFQRALKSLSRRGVLLGIVSKNDEAVALEAFRNHPEMALRWEDFAGRRINWDDKAKNIVELARELNLGLQSVVFIDDNPYERARVRETLPEVLVPEWPEDKMSYRAALLSLACFDQPHLTQEDKRRSEMYAGEAKRSALKAQIGSLDEWLRSLEIRVRAEPLKPENLARISQLINKTNQMNLRTRRMSEAELAAWAARPGHAVWGFTVEDRFGSSGLTGVVGLRHEGGSAFFEDFLLSCRVIGRRVEETLVHFACRAAREAACREIRAEYLPTAKNSPCLEFWMRSGFDRMGPDHVFVRDLSRDYPLPPVVTLS